MSEFEFVKHKKLWLKDNPEINEKWLQDRIADEPAILGLGDLVIRDKERSQPKAGFLDLLLQDIDGNNRYVVEIQLGKLDASHIIRTIEYWDIERKRYPQYEYIAVIIAEDITSRFLNVISLFNRAIPLIAIQLNAIKIENSISLIFTTVLDYTPLGLIDEDEKTTEKTDREYWERRGTKSTISMVDKVLEIINTFAPNLELNFTKFYIGLIKDNHVSNFVTFRPKKKFLRMEFRFNQSEQTVEELENAGVDVMDYDSQNGRYRIRLLKDDVKNYNDIIASYLKKSYDEFGGL